ncbi:MAG: tetratricopeptide repeat protein, partial [Leeuwenhoekiella sp.]
MGLKDLNIFRFKSVATTVLLFSLFAGFAINPSQDTIPQNDQLDSLLKEVLAATENMSYDTAINKASKLIKSAEKKHDDKYIFHGYNLLSISYFQIKDSVNSLQYARRALFYAKRAQNDTLLVWAYNNLAAGLSVHERNEALTLYKKSLSIARKLDDGDFLDAALNIAELYRDQGKYNLMPAYLKEAEKSLDPENISFDDLRHTISSLKGFKVHVVGDTIVDTYIRTVLI